MGRNERAGQSVPLLLLVLVLLLGGCSDEERLRVQIPPAARLGNLDGELRPVVGERWRIVNLWATWCPPCREEMPALQRLSEMTSGSAFEVIGISVDRDINLVREFLLKYDIRFPQLLDPEMELASDVLGTRAFPETLLVDPQGRVRNRRIGAEAWDDPELVTPFLQPAVDEGVKLPW